MARVPAIMNWSEFETQLRDRNVYAKLKLKLIILSLHIINFVCVI